MTGIERYCIRGFAIWDFRVSSRKERFYLFMKSPVADEKQFCEAAKKYHILIVPGSSFACPGYVRLAYCVSYETIINSLPEFAKLAAEYKEGKDESGNFR